MTKEEIILNDALQDAAHVLETKGYPMLANSVKDLEGRQRRQGNEIKLREERIDELVRSLKDIKEAYEKLVEEREKMLKYAVTAHKINYPDGTFIFRTKSLIIDDMEERGFERGDEFKFVIIKTPLAKIVEKK